MTPCPASGGHHRYPGLRSFGLEPVEHELFFGRRQETADLVQHIIGNRLTVLYGKSGLGKTSLLQAGVFPELRERGFLPLRVRLAGYQREPMTLLRTELTAEIQRETELDPGVEMVTREGADSWWGLFKNAVFWQGTRVAIPCLVLDQFEEIFTLCSPAERQALAEQLSHLVNGTVPPKELNAMRTGATTLSEEPPELRLVLSLRTEYVGRLQELFPRIPAILTRRFSIAPLDRERAADAVLKPAALPGDRFATQPFSYDDEALERVLHHLDTEDSGEIEPYQLQLQCREIERQVAQLQAAGQRQVRVDRQLVGDQDKLDQVVQHFYRDALDGLQQSARDARPGPLAAVRGRRARRAARALCELGLLSGEGHRWQMNEGQILQDYPALDRPLLDYLVEQRLLRREARGKDYVYELAHDSLAGPVFRQRATRLTPQAKKGLLVAAAVVALVVASLLAYTSLLERQKRYLTAEEAAATRTNEAYSDAAKNLVANLKEQNQRLVEELESANGQIEQLIDRNDRMLAALDAAQTEGISPEQAAAAAARLQADSEQSRQQQLSRGKTIARLTEQRVSVPAMVALRGGAFTMGCLQKNEGCQKHELPAHKVVMPAFSIGQHEVTFENYDPFALATGRILPDDLGWGRGKRPVFNVNWSDASAYAEWLGRQLQQDCRLPSEAEWEYAARAATTTAYAVPAPKGSNDITGRGLANCGRCASEQNDMTTAPVGSFPANAWGLYDMQGNVWEWTQDCWHDTYHAAPENGSPWLKNGGGDCSARVLRGGSWNNGTGDLRSAFRTREDPSFRHNSIGFRVVCTSR
jgi:formylglycine-generating enzyme required for sulfatase activity